VVPELAQVAVLAAVPVVVQPGVALLLVVVQQQVVQLQVVQLQQPVRQQLQLQPR